MRQLKHHEQKLLKKVDFLQWKSDQTLQQVQVMRQYHIQKREDYIKYNKLCGEIRQVAHRIALLPPTDPYRAQITDQLMEKLYNMGVLTQKNALSQCEKVSVSALCRRRLPVIMVRMKMAPTVKDATVMVEQGHVRVGPDCITDPAYLVTRTLEDYVTWTRQSSYREKIMRYNDQLDDFDLL